MADYDVFNPQSNIAPIPNWTRSIGSPVSQPLPDVSKGKQLETIATGIEGGAKVAETSLETWLNNRIRAGAEADQQATIQSYEEIRNAQIQGRQPDPTAVRTAGFGGSLVRGEGQQVLPPGLEAGLDKANQVGLAKAQGRGNDTLYTGALYSMAKQLRAQFPGHADFIDQQIAKITGIHPGNAYMQNLLIDINRATSGEDVYTKGVMARAMSSEYFGDKGVFTAVHALQAGQGSIDDVARAVGRRSAELIDQERYKNEHDRNKNDLEIDNKNAQSEWTKTANQLAVKHWDPIFHIPGLDTPDKIANLIHSEQMGEPTLSAQTWNQLDGAVTRAKFDFIKDLDDKANSLGYKTRMSPPEMEAINKSALTKFEALGQAIHDQHVGTMYSVKRDLEAQLDDTKKQAYDSPIGGFIKNSKVLQENLSPAWINKIDSQSLLDGKLNGEVSKFVQNAIKQASLPPELRQGRNNDSIYDSLVAMREAQQNGYKVPAVAYDNFIHNVDLIRQAQDPKYGPQGKEIAKNVVEYMFNPEKNGRVMDFFGKEMGQEKGRQYVYQIMTNPNVVDAIYNLNDPKSWNMFKEWQLKSFKTYFNDNIQDLNILANSGMSPSEIHYNAAGKGGGDAPWFDVKQSVPQSGQLTPAQIDQSRVTKRLNSGLANLSYMAKKEGSDPNEMVWDTMLSLGYQPKRNLSGDIPGRVMEAVRSSTKTNKELTEEALKKFGEKRKKEE
jgi:hypothetical protein